MDAIYIAHVDDEHLGEYGYDDITEDDHDNNNDMYARACTARVNTCTYIYIYMYINI